jgi:hypothetical protein
MMLDLLMVFMTIVALSIAGSLLFRRRFEYVLPVTVFSIILFAYCLAIFGLLRWLDLVSFILLFVCVLYILGHFITNKTDRTKSARLVFTSGLFLFLIISSFLILYNFGRMFTLWDEFTHWGLTAKNMFALDSFAIGSKANTVFQDYPPAMVLFQYFFSLYDKTFIEAHVIQASAVFSAGLLLAMFPRRHKPYWMTFLLVTVVLCLFVLVFYPHHFDQVYVDGILAILFAYIFLRVVDSAPMDNFRIAEITMGSMVLTLVKASGFFLALLAIVALLFPFNAKRFKLAMIPLAGVLSVKISWAWIVMNIGTHFDITKISPSIIADFFLGKGGYRYETVRNFLNALIFKPMSIFGGTKIIFGISISYFGYVVLVILIMFLLSRKLGEDNKKQIRILFVFLFISFIVYAFSLLFMYLFNFSEYEALRVASFGRYIGTFVLAFSLVWITMLADIYSEQVDSIWKRILHRKYILVSLVILLLVSGTLIYPKIKSRLLSWQATVAARAPYSQIEAYTRILKPEDRVYLISQHSQGYDYWVIRYNLTPTLTQNGFGSWSLGGKYDESDVWFRNISILDWKLELQSKYDYVYLYNVDERFISMYGALFTSIKDIKNKSLYFVNKGESGPTLLLVDSKNSTAENFEELCVLAG